ncbi:MAG: peptidase M16 domain protein [Microgenomates bacterium 39_6]|nr:MAG: peptidase M16 domain protein [Microgenomates bacterium 39_6]
MTQNKPYQRVVLPNGLTVFFINVNTVKTFYAILYVKVGAVNEDETNSGICHFLEHFVHERTKNYKNPKLFYEAIEFEGMYWGAATGRFDTRYWVASPVGKEEKALEFLYEPVFLSTLPQSRLNHVKEIVLNEYSDYWSDPETRFGQKMFLKRTKNKNVYQNDLLGRPETVKLLTKKVLLDWKEKHYQPTKMILFVVGNFNQQKVMTKIKSSFSKLKKAEEYKGFPKPKVSYSDFLVYRQKDKQDQVKFLLSFPAFGLKEVKLQKGIQAWLLNFIVGGSYCSRLSRVLREDNDLVYAVGSGLNVFPFMGEFAIRGSTARKNLLRSMSLIKQELEEIKKSGVTQKEIQKAKNLYRRDIICFNFETPWQIASWLVSEEFWSKKILLPEDYMKEAEVVSGKEVKVLAEDIFDFSKLNIGLRGNLKKDEVDMVKSVFKDF